MDAQTGSNHLSPRHADLIGDEFELFYTLTVTALCTSHHSASWKHPCCPRYVITDSCTGSAINRVESNQTLNISRILLIFLRPYRKTFLLEMWRMWGMTEGEKKGGIVGGIDV